MDSPPCGRQSCSATAGDAVISNISIGALPRTALTEWPTQAPSAVTASPEAAWGEPSQAQSPPWESSPSTSSLPTTMNLREEKQAVFEMAIAGMQPAVLAGSGGSIEG